MSMELVWTRIRRPRQLAGEGQCRGARIDEDGHAVLDEWQGGLCDPRLLPGADPDTFVEGPVALSPVEDGPAIDPPRMATQFEVAQVAPHGLGADGEPGREVLHGHPPVAFERIEDEIEATPGNPHRRHSLLCRRSGAMCPGPDADREMGPPKEQAVHQTSPATRFGAGSVSRWQAARSRDPRTPRCGLRVTQVSNACGQRDRNEQPVGRSIGLGGSPSEETILRPVAPLLQGRHRRQQGPRIGMAGIEEEALVIGEFHDLAEIHHGDTVAGFAHHGEVVADVDVGEAVRALERVEQGQQFELFRLVEGREGLVP